MKPSRLLIVMGDKAWTLAALHLACAMSRRDRAEVLLAKMIPVTHPLHLGTEYGRMNFTPEDAQELNELAATAEDYNVTLEVIRCYYANYWPTMVEAAQRVGATAVVTHIPPSPIPYWQELHRWWLHRKLARQNQLLLTLDNLAPSLIWTPSITLQDDTAVLLERHHLQHP